nr:alpha/beta-hydrolase family protein [Mesorhizobium microcysteis]
MTSMRSRETGIRTLPATILGWVAALGGSFCTVGLLLGTLFFAASLTPSLIPRDFVLQGVLSGCSFAAGYGIGVFARWLWSYLELPQPSRQIELSAKLSAAVFTIAAALLFLWRASEWQNSIRILMDLEPVAGARPMEVGLIALAVFIAIMMLARLFKLTLHLVSQYLHRYIPRRVANVLGALIAIAFFWSVVDGVLLRFGLRVADTSFQQFDALIESGVEQPADPLKTGSAASLIGWELLGRAGRQFVSSGPTRDEIAALSDGDAMEPIRVFVGLNSAETVEARVALALEELKRTGAFERSLLVLVTPTGTGWIDPSATDALEHLHRGDVASVAVQYSYLTSWLSLLIEPGYGAETSRALFAAVYEYWTALPENSRPRLYLHGLSLGALNSDLSFNIFDVVGDPFHGALWSGPPFSSVTWRAATSGRNTGSPAWLPQFRDGSAIRFANQTGMTKPPGAEWGPIRIVYLQYASDPVTFFEPGAFYREPAWMTGPRGPDVSDELRWYPVITLLQLALDMALATTAPIGHGHTYAPEHYVDAWMEVTQPQGWTPASIERLKAALTPEPEILRQAR